MFTFTVRPDGAEPFEAVATSRDIVRWEAMGKGRSLGVLADQMRMTDLTDVAYLASSRLGLFGGDIREFREQVDIDVEKTKTDDDGDGDDELGPTPADR